MTTSSLSKLAYPLIALSLAGCTVGPNYQRPSAIISSQFKEAAGFAPAAPADILSRGDWWTVFNDPVLSALAAKVQVSNQNVIAAEAAYRQARELVREQRASLFPTVNLNSSATRSGTGGGSSSTVVGGEIVGGSGGARNSYRVSLGASWEPDVWGRIRRTIEAARANAQASQADLEAATLSAQGELVADYFGLRQADVELALDKATVEGYRRSLTITQNRYNAGVAPKSDVLQAQTQLDNALADQAGTEQQRANYEHAIAVLTGTAPGDFTVAPVDNWTPQPVGVPPLVPSQLLERRPDIAAAERAMQSANAQIGIQRSAYFPNLSLTGSYGFAAGELGSLFNASNSVWSIGLSAAETLFDAGARRARVKGARAAYDQAVARYRQTVLDALQDVENQLIAGRVLATQYDLRRSASAAADQTEQMVFNRYEA
ncbi:MAG TPA: efflux transporter outer membrane subunit, partial [Caulobacteraceae bacterium]|nr:efflux transporter outer membrane subunit [Caulobacteraceae bacterium]